MNVKLWSLQAALLVSLLGGGYAAGEDKGKGKALDTPQPKVATCSEQAKERNLKGGERKLFVDACRKAERVVKNAQQKKMKECNKQAAGKKGDDRKTFLKECLRAEKT